MIEGLSLGRTSRVERVLSLLVESGLVYCVLWVRVVYDLSTTPSSCERERELTVNRPLSSHTKSVGRSKMGIPPVQTRRPDSRRSTTSSADVSSRLL